VDRSIDNVTLYEEKDWTSKIVDVWGISDFSLFKEATKILSASKAPFFAYIQTAANHRPYTIADDGSGFVTKTAAAEDLKLAGFNGNDQYNAVRLLDHNIGQLLTLFKTEQIYDNTIFVLFADHQGIPPKVNFMPDYIYQFDIDDLPVQLIIHSKRLVMPEQSLAFGNLVDLLPTISLQLQGYFPALP
jgi:phosphoglycerol transferase MdoB-like AlkP superfamily enzyme